MKFRHPFLQDIHLPSVGDKSRGTQGKMLATRESPYGRIEVTETRFRGYDARLLTVDGALQSALPVHREERTHLLFPYMRSFGWAFRLRPHITRILLLGGGGFAWPWHYLLSHPEGRLDVVESSEEILALSRRYFELEDLLALSEDGQRLQVFQAEACSYLLGSEEQYDLILNDAFQGSVADEDLMKPDGIVLLKAHLRPEGLYLCNLVTTPQGIRGFSGHLAERRIAAQFRNTTLLQADESRSVHEMQNCLLIASDGSLDM